MRQVVALRLEDEDGFLAVHPSWTMERRIQDDEGIVFLSFRLDAAAERKTQRLLNRATMAIVRLIRVPKNQKPLLLSYSPDQSLSRRRSVRYLPSPSERNPITVVAPPLFEVPLVSVFQN